MIAVLQLALRIMFCVLIFICGVGVAAAASTLSAVIEAAHVALWCACYGLTSKSSPGEPEADWLRRWLWVFALMMVASVLGLARDLSAV